MLRGILSCADFSKTICRNLLMLISISLTVYNTNAGVRIADSASSEPLRLKNYLAGNCADINWASWSNFSNRSATGTINNSGDVVNVIMTANYDFGSTSSIYNYNAKLAQYPATIPNNTVPKTEWSSAGNGTTTMCFSKTVTNPVLLLASLGSSSGISAKLTFDVPYVVIYDAGGMVYNDKYSVTGTEGYAIIMFPGDFNCVTVHSTTPENYTNLTWGLKPQPFQVDVTETANSCGTAVLTASGGSTYQWDDGDTPTSATNTFHQSGTYVVTATSVDGCKASVAKTITVNPIAQSLTVSGNRTGCGSVTLTVSGGSNYRWDGGDAPTSATNTFSQSGIYTVTSGNAPCTGSATVTVNVNEAPSVKFNGNLELYADQSEILQPQVTGNNIVSYSWSPVTGLNNPAIKNPTAQPDNTTDYTLTVTNASECSATATTTVIVRHDLTIYNAFSPNGDGVNDTWKIGHLNQDDLLSVDIYNRYGVAVFHSVGYPKPWDGTYKGKPVPAAVYYYVIKQSREQKPLSGYITVIR